MKSFIKTSEERSSSRNYDGIIQSFSYVDITFFNWIYYHFVYTWPFKSDFIWTKQNFRSLEFFAGKLNDLTIRKMIARKVFFVLFLILSFHILTYRYTNVTLKFFNFFDYFKFSCCVKNITWPSQESLKMSCDVSSTYIDSLDSIINRKTFKNWSAMANTISTIQHKSTCFTSGVQRQYGLLLKEYLRGSKFLEKYISCLNSIIVRVERRLC